MTQEETQQNDKQQHQTVSQVKCGALRQEFIDCVLQYSECVREEGTTFQECMKPPHKFPDECQGLRTALYQCKRSLIDRRARLRGDYTKKLG
jgi:cytochrome c oxidase assembly factor 5